MASSDDKPKENNTKNHFPTELFIENRSIVEYSSFYRSNINNTEIQCEINDLFERLAKEILTTIIEDFPKKVKQIELLRDSVKEFDWKLSQQKFHGKIERQQQQDVYNEDDIGDGPNTQWISSFCQTLVLPGTFALLTKDEMSYNGNYDCIQNYVSKPFLFDRYYQYKFNSPGPLSIYGNRHHRGSMMVNKNQINHKMINQMRPFVMELIILSQKINFALDILTPKIQDGHNFGVYVQTKAMDNVTDVLEECLHQLNLMSSYYRERNFMLSKMIINVQIKDYQLTFNEFDGITENSFRHSLNHLYYSYVLIEDFVRKNIDKLVRPRD